MNNEFWNGDCLELMKEIPDASVDMVLTDVPYNEVNRKSSGLRNLDKGLADNSIFDEFAFLSEVNRIIKGSAYIFCGIKQISYFTQVLSDFGLSTRLGIWEKTNPSPMNGSKIWLSGIEACVFARKPKATFNEHCKKAVWSFPSQRSKIHPTQKPIKLFEKLITASTNEGDIVLDPFSGSGTTAIACMNTGRNYICIEKDEEYYKKAIERVKNHEVS